MDHCQICGRAIKANTGVIAHHGYQRPAGWYSQTASCFGARFKPYEVAHDAIDALIPIVEKSLEEAKARLVDWNAHPAETLKYAPRDAYGKVRFEREYARPEGFDPATAYNPGTLNDYRGLFFNGRREREQAVRGMTEELSFLRQRRADWKGEAA